MVLYPNYFGTRLCCKNSAFWSCRHNEVVALTDGDSRPAVCPQFFSCISCRLKINEGRWKFSSSAVSFLFCLLESCGSFTCQSVLSVYFYACIFSSVSETVLCSAYLALIVVSSVKCVVGAVRRINSCAQTFVLASCLTAALAERSILASHYAASAPDTPQCSSHSSSQTLFTVCDVDILFALRIRRANRIFAIYPCCSMFQNYSSDIAASAVWNSFAYKL
jgi:hypothetical protein